MKSTLSNTSTSTDDWRTWWLDRDWSTTCSRTESFFRSDRVKSHNSVDGHDLYGSKGHPCRFPLSPLLHVHPFWTGSSPLPLTVSWLSFSVRKHTSPVDCRVRIYIFCWHYMIHFERARLALRTTATHSPIQMFPSSISSDILYWSHTSYSIRSVSVCV